MSKIVIISGSPTNPSRSAAISAYAETYLRNKQQEVIKISVRDLPPEDLLHANFASPVIKQHVAQIERAHAVIVVSPIYKATYTGVLKAFLDLIPERGFVNKILLPIATGGTTAHLLALEYAFKPLFSILGSQHVNSGVYVVDSQVSYERQGLIFHDELIKSRIDSALNQLVTQLVESENLIK